MTAHALITRRMMLRDMGKAGFAVMILGTAACASDPTENATPSIGPDSTSTPDEATPTTGPPASNTSTSGGPRGGYEWHRVHLSFVSAYILYRGGEAAIVDTGVGGSEGDIEAALGEVGLGWGDVGALVVTHLHPDHQGSVTAVVEATTDALPWFAGAGDIDGIEAPTEGQAVGDDDTVHSGLQIIETPGHTPGHISVLDPMSGILVAGDALNGANGGVAGPSPDFSQDMGLANASVAKLAAFNYEVALFGHGEPVLEDASGQVADLAESLDGG
jgi:glyoxylase-like metal-dependent hydrolase (beta-lactamase superfamily II)